MPYGPLPPKYKNTPPNIRSAISAVFGSSAPSSSVQSWVNNNYTKTAVDCSGLAYYVLNEASGGKVRPWFENKLGLVGKLDYAYGILAGHFITFHYSKRRNNILGNSVLDII